MIRRRAVRTVLAAVVACGGLVAGAAYASGRLSAIPGSDGSIHGCYRLSDGRLRVIDSARSACARDEAPIQWNQHGPAAQTPPLGPLSTAVAGLQTQVAGLQGQVVTLQTRVATIAVPPRTATTTVPSSTPTATVPARTPTSTATVTAPSPTPTATATVPAGLQSLAITPAFPPSILMSAQLTATGTFADGSTRDLTASVQWVLAGTSGASLTPGGFFTCPGGGAGGTFSVTATLGTVATTVQEGCPFG